MRRGILIVGVVLALVFAIIGFATIKVARSDDLQYYDDVEQESEDGDAEEEVESSISSNTWPKSVVRYAVNKEISSRFDCEEFDKKFVAFLEENGIVSTKTHLNRGELQMNQVTVKDDGLLTIDLNSNALIFDLQIQNHDRNIVSCAVCNGEYAFEID